MQEIDRRTIPIFPRAAWISPEVEAVPSHMRYFQPAFRMHHADRASSQPSPGVVPPSRPSLAISCIPTQMPRKGLPPAITASSAHLSCHQWPSGQPHNHQMRPPRQHDSISTATSAGSAVMARSTSISASRDAAINACPTDCKLPEP